MIISLTPSGNIPNFITTADITIINHNIDNGTVTLMYVSKGSNPMMSGPSGNLVMSGTDYEDWGNDNAILEAWAKPLIEAALEIVFTP